MSAIVMAAAMLAAGGPVTKYDDDTPKVDIVSPVAMFDIERCLIDLEGHPAPQVYRQPDRPDEVRMLWVVNNKAAGRADLRKAASGTAVKIWIPSNQMRSCAETGQRGAKK